VILAQSLALYDNDPSQALPLFDRIRLSYYARMYSHLASEAARRAKNLQDIGNPTFDERVANKIISDGGADMTWIYQNDIEATWKRATADLQSRREKGSEETTVTEIELQQLSD